MNSLLRCITIILLAVAPGAAQIHANKLSVPVDPSVRDQLARARDAMQADDLDRALLTWQAILDGAGGRVLKSHNGARDEYVSAESVVAGDRYIGVRRHVLGLIRALPADGLERYRALMEPRASRLFNDGVADVDERKLRDCIRRFILTPSGRDAAVSLIDLLIEEGRFPEARLAVQRLRDEDVGIEAADPLPERLVAREALALWGTRAVDALEDLVTRTRSSFAERSVTIGGRAVDVAGFVEGLAEQARAEQRLPGLPAPMHTRIEPNWSRAFTTDDWSDTSGSYPVVPTVHEDLVFYSDGRYLRARRVVSGTDCWPPVESPTDEYDTVGDPDVDHRVVIDRDLVIGYLESAPMMQNPWRSRRRAVAGFKLIAVDHSTGKVRWSHFAFKGRDKEETDFIAKLSVCQPPLVVGDTLYVAGTLLKGIFHHWVCAIERDTGHVRWRTYVGAGQTEVSRGGNPTRACLPGYVAEHRGVLYHATHMGVLCAVDALTGAIEWQSAHEQDRVERDPWSGRRGWGGWGRRSRYSTRNRGWRHARPTIVSGRLFMTAEDASFLYVVEPATGKLTRIPSPALDLRSESPVLVGAHGGQIILAGGRMTALRASDLRIAWRFPDLADLDGNRSLRGMPALEDGRIVLSSYGRTAQLEILDPATGERRLRRPLRDLGRVGNVSISDGSTIIATDSAVSAIVRE